MTEDNLEMFLKKEKKRNIKRLISWVVILIIVLMIVTGGMFLIFNSIVNMFMR